MTLAAVSGMQPWQPPSPPRTRLQIYPNGRTRISSTSPHSSSSHAGNPSSFACPCTFWSLQYILRSIPQAITCDWQSGGSAAQTESSGLPAPFSRSDWKLVSSPTAAAQVRGPSPHIFDIYSNPIFAPNSLVLPTFMPEPWLRTPSNY